MSATALPNTTYNLIQTKLHRPVAREDLVRRARLLDLLDRGCTLPLTLVMAPAGSGKTTLLSDWLNVCPCPSAWVSLDESDSDLGVFISYFIAAIRTLFPDACQQTLALLQAAELPPTRVLAGTLLNEIEELHDHPLRADKQRFVLVLDDYQMISGQEVNELLIELLRHPSQTMRLVISTRNDPALPLNKLRAGGLLTELRRHDLRFSTEETREYLQRSTKRPVSEAVAAALTDKTEGWITGLHLAVLNLRHVTDSDEFVAGFEASERYTMDYLVDEVLSRQSAQVQQFLLQTSVLDRMCGPLCEAVASLSDPVLDGYAYLNGLERANLFLVALDNQQRWFRYHHLFQLLLRNRLEQQYSRAEIAELHRKASAWYADNGYVEDAIVHALAAGDEEIAVRAVETHRHEAMNQERWLQIDRWLRLMPRQLVDEQPSLLLMRAWNLERQWRFLDIPHYLKEFDARFAAHGQGAAARQLQGEADALRSLVSYFALDSGEHTSALASHALEVLPMACSRTRGIAWLYYAAGFQAQGKTRRARKLFLEGLNEDSLHGNSFPSRILMGLCILDWLNTDLSSLRDVAGHFLRLARERGLTESIGWARYFLGIAAYDANDLDLAESEFAAVAEQRYVAHGGAYTQSGIGLASVHLARGALDQAAEVLDAVAAYGLETNNSRVLADADTFRALLALEQGQTALARRQVTTLVDVSLKLPAVAFFNQDVTNARILLSLATPADLNRAETVMLRLRNHVAKSSNTRRKVELLILQALLEDERGNRTAALAYLQQAVDLAEPGGVLRVFVDLGPKTADLLTILRKQNRSSGFIGRILQAFPPAVVRGLDQVYTVPEVANQSGLIEPLTNRELEVLEKLALRLTAKEIAGDLYISERTVKRHTANIYKKLDVNSRQQAVASAAYLGILNTPIL
ncbi:MAG: LuxR C-terminal-related transcriptional regulator [Caldilineales bacterium]